MTELLAPLDVAPRLERLRAVLEGAEVDTIIVTTLPNIRYLTGFSGSAGILAVTADKAMLTTDGRYRTQSALQLAEAAVDHKIDITIGAQAGQVEGIKSVATGRVGLEADSISWASQRRWAEWLDAELVPTSGLVEGLRQIKDAGEIDRMARAAKIADDALGEILYLLGEAGTRTVTESEVALSLDTAMRRRGAEDRAFDTIVASGPTNSAKPHHQPTDRPLEVGDPVVIDFGAIFEGYRSDMTRTFCVGGEPTGELARIFAVVADSQAQGVAAVRPGVGAKEVDDVCRHVITEAGWASAFEHGTGHGVGLDIHEAPYVSQMGTAILTPGFVVTVEPGVYIPGVGGVRIEDTLVVTDDGARALTGFAKDVAA